VVVDVTDDGPGIAAEELPQLFTMFRRGAWARTNAPGGLGIGLALSRRLAAMHGGSVEVRSDGPGHGSTFTVRLPAAAPPQEAPGEAPADGAMAAHRILVVDDNRDAAESLAVVLRHLGAHVHVAHDGATALAAVDDHAPSVVLLDIGMPGMDGYEVARRLRSVRAKPPLLVALTGWGQDDDRRRAYEAGFDHHLVKPADIARLQRLLSATGAGDEGGRPD
jgi:CheY-like chemotaxis protein